MSSSFNQHIAPATQVVYCKKGSLPQALEHSSSFPSVVSLISVSCSALCESETNASGLQPQVTGVRPGALWTYFCQSLERAGLFTTPLDLYQTARQHRNRWFPRWVTPDMEPPTYIQGVTPSLSVGSLLLPALNNSPVNAYFLREPACSRFTRGLENASPITKREANL